MDRYLSQAAQQRALADSALIERACAGDHTAFEILVSRYECDLYRFVCNRLDSEEAQDVVQFVWLQFNRFMSTLQRNPPAEWSDLSLKPWLLRVAQSPASSSVDAAELGHGVGT
jgi:DNA-directed RNA polymerase specialized sigma24 family protein